MFHSIFDTHCHYLDDAFMEDRAEVLKKLPSMGVSLATLAGTNLDDSIAGVNLAAQYPWLYTSVGIHPEFAGSEPADYLERLASLAKNPKVRAIGEIGLDYHYPGYDKIEQYRLFQQQLELAKDLGLPVMIHARDCTQDYLDILKYYQPKGVVHCFSSSAETAQEVLKLGMYIGFTGVLTFKNAKKALRALEVVPMDKLVLETDCPYMAPVPFRGKRCDSSMIAYTAQAAAMIKGIDTQTMLLQTKENGMRLYAIDRISGIER